jgi:hypothetical protein
MVRPWLQMGCLGVTVWLLGFSPCAGLAQPLDTMSGPEPAGAARHSAGGAVSAPRDTMQQNTPASPGAVIEIGADTTRQESKPAAVAARQSEPIVRLALPPDLDTKFSLFNQRNIIGIGPSLSYFYYNEHLDINPIIQEFRSLHTYQPAIAGTPKSTEYGAVLGFTVSSMWVFRAPSLVLRSRFAMLFGIANTYDGSSQADTSQAPGTITFTPIKDQKNNFFATGGIDLGYAFPTARCPWALYSGIDAKIWYRDMTLYSQQSSSATSSELYYWFSVPLGALVMRPVSPHVLLGCDARIDFMFYGRMQASETSPYGGSLDFPILTLGNRASYRLDAFLQTRPSGSVSFRFGPYVMLYGFAQSNTDTVTIPGGYDGSTDQRVAFLEPESASFWIGINFQVEFLRARRAEVKDR